MRNAQRVQRRLGHLSQLRKRHVAAVSRVQNQQQHRNLELQCGRGNRIARIEHAGVLHEQRGTTTAKIGSCTNAYALLFPGERHVDQLLVRGKPVLELAETCVGQRGDNADPAAPQAAQDGGRLLAGGPRTRFGFFRHCGFSTRGFNCRINDGFAFNTSERT